MLARRDSLPARAAAAAAASRHFPLVSARAPKTVAAYLPMGSEIDPGPLLERLAAAGSAVLLPVVVRRGAALIFREAGDTARFVPDAAGILAPPPGAAEAVPDLVLAPLLAFDRYGGRLGYGGGYYDRTLAALRAAPGVLAVGLAFSGQEVDRVPHDAHDQMLDAICTEVGYRAALS
jgi:5-formyltetrahydrofolate cyclo-ligase